MKNCLTRVAAVVLVSLMPLRAWACDTALLLLIDVSNSIDTAEYRLQTDGLADALRDPEVIEVILQGQVALAVVQWSGADRQEISLPWAQMRSAQDVALFSSQARAMDRAFVLSGTAPGEAIAFATRYFSAAPACDRWVIDISGDGTANAGQAVPPAVRAAEQAGITINGIAIEGLGVTITNYYERTVTTRDGFVVTARGHREYPDAIRRKILRELSQVIG